MKSNPVSQMRKPFSERKVGLPDPGWEAQSWEVRCTWFPRPGVLYWGRLAHLAGKELCLSLEVGCESRPCECKFSFATQSNVSKAERAELGV